MRETFDLPRILIAEDEQIVALDVETGLGELGYQVVGVASSGSEVIRLAEEMRPDLVLMDIQLDGPTDGIAAAHEIRRHWQIPVVFVTGNAGADMLSRAKAAEPYGYVTKPFSPKELNATVTVALHQHRLTRERQQKEREGKQLIRELERSNTELERFSHTVAHDLQAPVRTIRTLADLLLRRLQSQLAPEDSKMLALMLEAAGSMHRLIESLLSYAQAGHEQLNRETISAGETVSAVRTILAPQIAETSAEVVCGALPVISADRVQFQQLLQNLVGNAIKYRRPGQRPEIVISGEDTDEGWHFAVSDNGCGVPAEKRQHIFEPLTRLHGTEVPGTGMGLALCRTIVERHGGRIWAESSRVEAGTTFHFILRRPAEDVSQ